MKTGIGEIERNRLKDDAWRLWGPYLSERQWGTVREDYSADGAAWEYFSHDAARARAYRWGEDGIGGISDDRQLLCFAWAFWNGQDPILKERLFGLTGNEGNHGEDVKEVYYYLDSTPSHSYMKMLYKYPQAAFPYNQLVEENKRRSKTDPEHELVDTGVFDDRRYFDCFIEYAKVAPRDILMRVTVHNRGDLAATCSVIPQLWFRNTWSWNGTTQKPIVKLDSGAITADHPDLDTYQLYFETGAHPIFCDNETNPEIFTGVSDDHGYWKDAFHRYVIARDLTKVNPLHSGTKAGLLIKLDIPAGGSKVINLRLCSDRQVKPFQGFDKKFATAIAEADNFYEKLQAPLHDDDAKLVQRQAFAGMLWSKQYYHYNVAEWLAGDSGQPPPPGTRRENRNSEWNHLSNSAVISMPDKWEYPWYAAWDLAFHCIPLALLDAEFAKRQLLLLVHEWYIHPNGQIPAYEWSFSDVNPPVQAWAAWRVYKIDQKQRGGHGDRAFLERIFQKLLLNFTWWVNRKDEHNHNIFQGGFLGLDNIGVFDRSRPLPTGGHLEQADATAWVAMYALNLMRIALELACENPVYQDLATKFFEHFLLIAKAMVNIGGDDLQLWDDNDGFYYDVLHSDHTGYTPLKIRSMVGIIPLFAVEVLDPDLLKTVPQFAERLESTLKSRPDLASLVSRWQEPGQGERRLLSLVRGHRMKKILRRVLDETEFLSDYGVRAVSKYHQDQPYTFDVGNETLTVRYSPAESDSGLFGGNSNWRGPIWFPVNYLLIEALQRFHHYYGDDFTIECPVGSGTMVTIAQAADEIARRLSRLFLRDSKGQRPVFGEQVIFANDPDFKDYIPFHEYFHGDSGRGLGASHQTGWTGLIAKLLIPRSEGVRPS